MPLAVGSKVVWLKKGLQDLLEQEQAAIAAVGPGHLATVHLSKFSGDVTALTDETALDEVVVGDWAEYVPIATTGWGATETRPDGSVIQYATPLLSWTGPAAGGGPTVYGAYLKSPLAGTHLIAYVKFAAPVGMNDDSQILDFVCPLLIPAAAANV